MSNFSLLDTLNGSRWDTSANNINTVGYVSCNGGTAVGTYYSNNVSAFRVPNGPTSSRPSPGLVGYLRFNTDQSYNCLEYYDPLSALWTPIYPIPGITSVTPDFVTDTSGAIGGGSYYNTNPLVISGYGYVPGCTVSYRGIDSSVYAAPSTTYVSSTRLNASVPASVYSTGYNQDPFTIVVTNPTGVSGFLLNALDVDPSASWVTPAGLLTNSAGATSVDSSAVLTTTAPYFRVQAIDLEGNAITYNSPDISSNLATRNCAITTFGGYGYITGTPYSLTNATVSFTVNALDGRQITPRSFSLNVNAALRTADVSSNSGFAYQITYTDAAGQNPTSSGPYANGYTVYTFNPNASSEVLLPISPQSVNTYQTSAATYTFKPNFASSTYSVLVVGGGGAGAGDAGTGPSSGGNGGGGGGGVLYNNNTLTMTQGVTYTITVGAGAGIGSNPTQSQRLGGGSSIISGSGFTTLTANGGGGGGYYTGEVGQAGGSGGGAANNNGGGGGATTQTSTATATGAGGSGSGGTGSTGGGGGGAGGSATNQNGAAGISNSITGNAVTYAGGGGGTGSSNGNGGAGGGTTGAVNPTRGTDGLGGGSGAQISGGNTARGGSGVVIIRFKSYSG